VLTVRLVNLTTGVCPPWQAPNLLSPRFLFAAKEVSGRAHRLRGRLQSLRWWFVVGEGARTGGAACGMDLETTARDDCWAAGCGGCVISDGRFAVLGGISPDVRATPSCEVLVSGL
jgi:hypothetical protein